MALFDKSASLYIVPVIILIIVAMVIFASDYQRANLLIEIAYSILAAGLVGHILFIVIRKRFKSDKPMSTNR